MSMSRRLLLAALALALPVLPAGLAVASQDVLPPPVGEVVLTVRGSVAVANDGAAARLDRAALHAMGLDELRTATPWTDGAETFTGVLAARLLEALGARGTRVRARALNDYAATIPLEELRAYPVLLALERGGRPLSVRERGPVWIIYPWSSHPELDTRVHRKRSVWQLHELVVE